MGRIKQGLDYFPLNTDLMHNRALRRIMKREGDSAFTVLLYTLSYLYAGEGYYVRADNNFCDELSDQLFNTDQEHVHRILRLFVTYGFFDSALYERYGILTSADIQRQYLFITKRRRSRNFLSDYCLLPEEEMEQPVDGEQAPRTAAAAGVQAGKSSGISGTHVVSETPDDVYRSSHAAAETPEFATKITYIERKEKERKENILPNPPCQGGEVEREGGDSSEYGEGGKTGDESVATQTSGRKRGLTQEDIDRMQPPVDGVKRNFAGLVDNLRLYRIPPAEQYAIVMKSNYGEIGGKVWVGFATIHGSNGKIKLPGHYLLSVLK